MSHHILGASQATVRHTHGASGTLARPDRYTTSTVRLNQNEFMSNVEFVKQDLQRNATLRFWGRINCARCRAVQPPA
eukprot:1836829-Pleurochrysis_carterae.AAC.2